MKHRIFLIFFLILSLHKYTDAQSNYDKNIILNADAVRVSFEKNEYFRPGKIPFRNIVVYDYRFDTSKLGYLEPWLSSTRYKQIQLQSNWNQLLNNYFKNNLDSASNTTLCIYIRSFWMKRGYFDAISSKKIKVDLEGGMEEYGYCKAALDVYICSDSSLQALFKIEDAFLNFYDFRKGQIDKWIFLPFDSVVHRIQKEGQILLSTQRKKLLPSEVKEFYLKRFNMPVLTNSLKKGVFMTFNDFKKNEPVDVEIKLKKGKLTDELYIINNKNEEIVSDYWGLYDGNNLFIRSGFNVFPAIRINNSFEIYGAKYISNVHNLPQPGDLYRLNKMKVFKTILQINMDTGVLY
jgi:hypothetical protein